MSKKKRDRMKAKERRHAASRPPTQPSATGAVKSPSGRPVRRSTPKGKKRQRAGWLGLTPRQWMWIAIGAVAIAATIVLAWWFTRQPAAAPAPTPEAKGERPVAAVAPADRVDYYDAAPEMQIDETKQYVATIHTEKGDIVVELYPDKVPMTVNNFVFLANQGYYDNTTFHRVIPGFMAQAGDPSGTGGGGPGYTFEDEFDPVLRHDGPGVLSMANRGPDTNGGQFFIIYEAQPHLDDKHSVFGKVVEGTDVLEQLTPRDPGQATEPGDLIESVTVEER